MMKRILFLALLGGGACSDSLAPAHHADGRQLTEAADLTPRASDRPASAMLGWNALTRQLATTPPMSAAVATRAYAIVRVAQFAGLEAAEHAHLGKSAARRAAIAGAAARALTYLFPDAAASIEATVSEQAQSEPADDIATAEALGRAAAVEVVEREIGRAHV